MGRNPFLEVEDSAAPTTRRSTRMPATASRSSLKPAIGRRRCWRRSATRRTSATAGSSRRRACARRACESDIGALDLIAADVGLRQHLHSQINVLPLSRRDHALACAIVESLDDDGYLRTDARGARRDPRHARPAVEAIEMQIALKRVQSLDPLRRRRAQRLGMPAAAARQRSTTRRARARAPRSSPTISTGSPSTTSTASPDCSKQHAGGDRGGRASASATSTRGRAGRVDSSDAPSTSRPT